MEVVIRAAGASDLAAVRALMQRRAAQPVRGRLAKLRRRGGRGRRGGRLRPAPAGRAGGSRARLAVVRADLRGGGIGARLVEAALARASGRRVLLVTALAEAGLRRSMGFPAGGYGRGAVAGPAQLAARAGRQPRALAHGMRPRRLAILERAVQHDPDLGGPALQHRARARAAGAQRRPARRWPRELGYRRPRTLLATGNLIFEADAPESGRSRPRSSRLSRNGSAGRSTSSSAPATAGRR